MRFALVRIAGLCLATLAAQGALAESIADPVGEAETFYAVQVASFPSAAEARGRSGEFASKGIAGTRVENADGKARVVAGHFDTYVDALEFAEGLRRGGKAADAFIVKVAPTAEAKALAETDGPALRVFAKEGERAATAALKSMKGIAEYEALQAVEKEQGDDAYRAALLATCDRCAPTDPLKGYVEANLGILELKAGKEHYESALAHLVPVAKGEVPASASVRAMAMRRAAWLLHQTGNRLEAYAAYKELEEYSDSDAVKAVARTEQVGLLMELAESGKGTHAEMRRAAREAFAATPESELKQRAVLELMYLETYARQPEPDYHIAAALIESFLSKYSPLEAESPGKLAREILAAKSMAGLFYSKVGEFDRAMELYEELLRTDTASADSFAGANPRAEALLGLSNVLRMKGDVKRSDEVRVALLEMYPDEEAAQKIAQVQPWLHNEDAEKSATDGVSK